MTTKKVDPTAVINDYINSVIEKEGGREALLKKLTAEKLTTFIAETSWESTLGQLDKAAQEKGLLESLKALTLKELKNILAPAPKPKKKGRPPGKAKKAASPKKGKKKGKRGASYLPILTFLIKKPGSSSAQIQDGTDIDSKTMGPRLQYLGPKMGLITGKGKLKKKVWSITPKGKKYLEGK
jgi:predicted transcriptional regulator